MTPIDFPERNDYLGKPSNMSDEECTALPIHRAEVDLNGQKYPCFISVWQMDEKEREEFLRTGKLYVQTFGVTQYPQSYSVQNPFIAVPTLSLLVRISDEDLEGIHHNYEKQFTLDIRSVNNKTKLNIRSLFYIQEKFLLTNCVDHNNNSVAFIGCKVKTFSEDSCTIGYDATNLK